MNRIKTLLLASAFGLLAAPALAATTATATTDLNVRTGPGPGFPVTGMIGASQSATVNGCLDNSKWCQVTVNGTTGWAYSDYLVADVGGQNVVVYEQREQIGVPVVTYDGPEAELTGAATGAIAGAVIGGPVGAAIGGAAGAIAGDVLDPDRTVTTYVEQNPVDPVYLEGEVVVGAQVPEAVPLHEIPEAPYRYVYVNGTRVLVEPENRQIVYIYR